MKTYRIQFLDCGGDGMRNVASGWKVLNSENDEPFELLSRDQAVSLVRMLRKGNDCPLVSQYNNASAWRTVSSTGEYENI